MASGKTTFGRAAAKQLGWDFVDLDQVITERYGTPAEIFAARGESAFRDIETQVLGETLGSVRDTVLSLGGGTVLRDENLQLLRQHARIIWLDTDFAIIISEIGNADRPVVRGRSIADIRTLYDERRPRYAAAADLIFPIATTDYDQVIADLAETIRQLSLNIPIQ